MIEEYEEDIRTKASSNACKKKDDMLLLEWYDDSTPYKGSKTSRSVTPKSIPQGLVVHLKIIVPYTKLSVVDLGDTDPNDLP